MVNIVQCQEKPQFSAKLPRDEERNGETRGYTGAFVGVVGALGNGAQRLEMSSVILVPKNSQLL